MKYTFNAQGHPNITSKHSTTWEVTCDQDMGKSGDCIIGLCSQSRLKDIPEQMRKSIQQENHHIRVILETENYKEEISGSGHPSLSLDHPTDMVCRTSDYTCSRTLMIKADKAAKDLSPDLIAELRAGKKLKITIIV